MGPGESSLAEPWEKERNGNERILLRMGIFDPLPGPSNIGHTMGNNWAPRYAGPSHLRSHFNYRESSSSQSGSGSMDTRYFDEGRLPDRFSIHDADGQAPTGGMNLDLATYANDTTGRLFHVSFIHKHLFIPDSDGKGKGKAREPITQNEPSIGPFCRT